MPLKRGALTHVIVHHSAGCAYESGECTCSPDIDVLDAGGDVFRVDEHGRATRIVGRA
jgi:hypothetical protein